MTRRPRGTIHADAARLLGSVRRVLATAALAVALLGHPVAVLAECTYFPIPPATDAAASARELFVATVVENVGDQMTHYRVRIDMVLRGDAQPGDMQEFDALYPGWPPALNEDGSVATDEDGSPYLPCAPIPAWKGNVVVFALDALAPDGKTRYNAASWISGSLPFAVDTPRTTLGEIRRLAGVPDTASSPPPRVGGAGGGWDPALPLLAGGAGLIGLVAGWQRLSRRRGRGRGRAKPVMYEPGAW